MEKHGWLECKFEATILDSSLTVSQEIKNKLPFDPTIPFLNIYTRELRTFIFYKRIYSCLHYSWDLKTVTNLLDEINGD